MSVDEETEFEREQRKMFEAFHSFYDIPEEELRRWEKELAEEQDEGAK